MDTAKIHPKFADEKMCKNPKCGAYFLSKEPQDFCKFCRGRGITSDSVEIAKNVIYKEVNTVELEARIAGLEKRVEILEKFDTALLEKSPDSKVFKDRKCANCGKIFTPAAPNQQLCDKCREILIK